MRLANEIRGLALSDEVFGQSIEDMERLFGGVIEYPDNPGQALWFRSYDGQVTAAAGGESTFVTVEGIDDPANAVKWTALHAYSAKGGIALKDSLEGDVPGVMGFKEWDGRASLIRDRISKDYQAGRITDYNAAIKSAPELSFTATAMYRAESGRVIPLQPADLDILPESILRESFTRFSTLGETLPEAVRRLVNGYKGLSFHVNEASVVVGNMLGADTAEQFYTLWNGTQRQKTPLAAAKLMLSSLS